MAELVASLLVFLVFAAFLAAVLWTLVVVLRRGDLSRGKKAVWLAFLVVFPLIGVVVYYVLDVYRRTDLSSGPKVAWWAALVIFSGITVPIYIVGARASRANDQAPQPTPTDDR
jgi:hypothetical protein